MNILEEIQEISSHYDLLQNYLNNLTNELSIVDSKISDIQHYIENNKLETFECYRIVKEYKKILLERRKIKNDIELSRVFNQEQHKIMSLENRKFLLSSLYKANNKLNNAIYKNRIYHDGELEKICGGK